MPDHRDPESGSSHPEFQTLPLAVDDTEVDGTEVDGTQITALVRQSPAPHARVHFGRQLERGAGVGRYVVIDVLGKGGMGVVYAAYDPELGRRIALKLVRVDHGPVGDKASKRERILREAQALAQLSHPNVVAVYDVGRFEESVFIAMELVEGNTLRKWRKAREHSWQEIVRVFVAAGRGLAAAHTANIIHRDFKPDNVLIGDDGGVRVADFGLARAAEVSASDNSASDDRDPTEDDAAAEDGRTGEEPDDDDSDQSGEQSSQSWRDQISESGTVPSSSALLGPLTETGMIMGTPRYMAPEQHLGLEVTAQTDQYSFCVALHEALYGQHPFPTHDRTAIRAHVTMGQITEPDNPGRIPARLRRLIKRGMALDPESRYPSMQVLLADLARDPWVSRRRLAAAVAVLVFTGLTLFGVFRNQASVQNYCTGFEEQLGGAWDHERAAAIKAAFLATERHHAAATYARVDKLFSTYADEWLALNTSSCRATRRGQQSEKLLDRRSACLERLREQLGALTSVLAEKPDGVVVDGAVKAVLRLPPVASCANDEALTAAVPLPVDPEHREQSEVLRRQLLRISALDQAGKRDTAMAELTPLLPAARALDYAPNLNSALLLLASLQRKSGDTKAALSTLEELVVLAAKAKNDTVVARVWIEILSIIGTDEKRFADALALRPAAAAAVARIDDQALVATLHGVLAEIFWAQGDLAAARQEHQRAIAIREVYRPTHPELARSYNNYGNVLWHERRFDEAERYYRRALEIWEESLGPDHPEVATALTNLANVLNAQGRDTESEPLYRRAIELKQASLGPDHPSVATSLANLAEALKHQKRLDEALVYMERALKIWRAHYGEQHPHVAIALNNIGAVYKSRSEYAKAADYYQRAAAIFVEALGADHVYVGHALTGLGHCDLELGRADQARTELERAVKLLGKNADPHITGEANFALARSLIATHGDRKRAIALAQQALELFVAEKDEGWIRTTQRWLDGHSSQR